MKREEIPVALTIAGSDSGGGAGVQADLKTFAALGVHGTSAITCITAQNPRRVLAVQPCEVKMLRAQLKAVFEELPPSAVKIGMLGNGGLAAEVARFYKRTRRPPLVVDPVMISTSGTRLLDDDGIAMLREALLPLAALVTPNVAEARLLADRRIRDAEDLRRAARIIHGRYGCAVLAKGGHLGDSREAADIFFDGREELLLVAPRVRGLRTHGTGCTYSAAIAGFLALGRPLSEAVREAKEFITRAIAESRIAGGHTVLNW
ncbi:MAG: bifunctional hydroxymethylpyrimidine kinase/phosphomethylpyrimidine kinase [Verrucomicrobia bacterium]|nr:bifunctional hydroxymethylpyrimidine kinase/phosphomethylpyrimidine kinase [Verrucomicrobiota bacterium]